jgi:hypothetical protein
VGCEGRCIVYRGPKLLHLAITFRVERSFTEMPNGSNDEDIPSIDNNIIKNKDATNIVGPVTRKRAKQS